MPPPPGPSHLPPPSVGLPPPGFYPPPGPHGYGPPPPPHPYGGMIYPPLGPSVTYHHPQPYLGGPPPPGAVLAAAPGAPAKAVPRMMGGETWFDPTLGAWPANDFRIFVGNLGQEVTDEVLAGAFARFPNFAMARVVRDKRLSKSRGFGFASFLDASDGAAALRSMDGQYVGNRPCTLRKSSWEERSLGAPETKGGGKKGGGGSRVPDKRTMKRHNLLLTKK